MSEVFVYSKDIGNLYYCLDLIYYDRPLLFLLNDEGNNLYIVTVIETEPNEKWLISPIKATEMVRVAEGELTGYDAFHMSEDNLIFQGTLYNNVIETEIKNVSEISDEYFPLKTNCLSNSEIIDELRAYSRLDTFPPKYKNIKENAAREENSLEVRFNSEQKSNLVDITLLGNVLVNLQKLTSTINQKSERSRARASKNIFRDTTWNAFAVAPGSFKIKLVNIPEKIDGRDALTDNMISILNILESTSNSQTFLKQLTYNNTATIKIINKILSNLKNYNTDFDLEFTSINNYERKISINQRQIDSSLTILSEKQKKKIDRYEITGTLTTFSKNKKIFELEATDGNVYKGFVDNELSKREVSVNGPPLKFVIQEYEEMSLLETKGKKIKELLEIRNE